MGSVEQPKGFRRSVRRSADNSACNMARATCRVPAPHHVRSWRMYVWIVREIVAVPKGVGAGSAGRPTTAAGAGAGPAAARFLRSGCSCSSWLTALYSALPAEAAHAASGHTSALALPCRGRARFGTSGLCGMSSSVRITTRRRPRSIVGLREYALSCAETGARRTRLSARAGGDAAPPSAAGGGSVLKHAPRTARVFAGW